MSDAASNPRVIEGYYRCPFPFSIATDALTEAFPIQVGGHRAVITFPSADGVTGHPELQEPAWHYTEHDIPQSRLPGAEAFWGTGAIWRTGDTPIAVHINRFRLCIEVDANDAETPEIARSVAEAMPAWWRMVGAWIEVLYQQDLSRLGPIAPGVHFTGTTLWTKLDRVHGGVIPVGSSLGRFIMVRYTAVDAAGLRRCIDLAQESGPPPEEWLVIRDARSFFNGYDFRRAVLDAGLVAELSVTRLITERLVSEGRSSASIKRTLRKHRMLTPLCDYWVSQGGTLPHDYEKRLIERRNAATHAGQAISRDAARDAVAVAVEIVDQALPLPS